MRIRVLRNIGGRPELREGAESEIDDKTGESLRRLGLAERLDEDIPEVIEAVPENDIETVPPRRKRGRPGKTTEPEDE